jgi:S1-C subfamily serine protease
VNNSQKPSQLFLRTMDVRVRRDARPSSTNTSAQPTARLDGRTRPSCILQIADRLNWATSIPVLFLFCCAPAFGQQASPTDAEWEAILAAESARITAIEKVSPTVVAVFGADPSTGGGSGVLIDRRGFALTNHHVVAAAGKEGWAGLDDGKLYRWKLIGTDPGGDLAMIQLAGRSDFPAAQLGDSDKVRVGDYAMALGNPFTLAEDYKPTVTAGIVSGVNRYQYGLGQNELVYGNCIQVDSSINPGNSGGPLFDRSGLLIGINGRGSFQERGRVNVGLGYAISINQCKLFLPDLLATKVAQHGTLDAIFGMRGGKVVCHTLNLDGTSGRSGLELGDELLKFEGKDVLSSNQFANLISTLPAFWPAQLEVLTDDGKNQPETLNIRLAPLPYSEKKPQAEVEVPADEEDGKPKIVVVEKGFGKPGAIGDVALNETHAKLILDDMRHADVADAVSSEHIGKVADADGHLLGTWNLRLSTDGKFRLVATVEETTLAFRFDGVSMMQWHTDAWKPVEFVDAAKSQLGLFAFAIALQNDLIKAQDWQWQIFGGDAVAGNWSHLLLTRLTKDLPLHVWIKPQQGLSEHNSVVKIGTELDGPATNPAVRIDRWTATGGKLFPGVSSIVSGTGETVTETWTFDKSTEIKEVADDWLDASP